MGNYNPAMQKVHLADVESDAHGLISKRTAEFDGLSVTQVTVTGELVGPTISRSTPAPSYASYPMWRW